MSDKTVSMDIFSANTDGSRKADAIKTSEFTYDKKFKQLFSAKGFLAPILKNIIPEYRDCPLEQIETLITPRGDVAVNPAAYSSEDSGKGDEMPTHYDVLIDCALPDNEKVCVDLFFDLEMQRKNRPGYSVPRRGVYYCCRLISRQLDVLDKEESYDKVKPVYSVWILVNDIPVELRNSVCNVDLSRNFYDEGLDASEPAAKISREVDLIHLRLIYLSEDFHIEEGQSDLVKYLQSVFANKVCNADCNPYYEYSKKIEKEVGAVMSVAEVFIARAERRGERIGELRGKRSGKVLALLQFGIADREIIQYLTSNPDDPLTEDEAAEVLESCRRENQ